MSHHLSVYLFDVFITYTQGFIRVIGTEFSVEFSTKQPRTLKTLPYTSGGAQAWHVVDLGYSSAYSTITGGLFVCSV